MFNHALTIQTLRNQLQTLEHSRARQYLSGTISTGVAALDSLLPSGGITSGTLCEWLSPDAGSLAGTLSLLSLREVLRTPGAHGALIDGQDEVSPLACAGWGIDLARLLFVHPASRQEAWWVVEQCLRSKGVQVVWTRLQEVPERVLRRWLLAAEAGGSVGLFLRPERVRGAPAWSQIRFSVELVPGVGNSGSHRLGIELLACRHGTTGQRVMVDLDYESHSVRVVSPMERSASPLAATGT